MSEAKDILSLIICILAGDNVYHCRECVSLGKLIYLAVAFL